MSILSKLFGKSTKEPLTDKIRSAVETVNRFLSDSEQKVIGESQPISWKALLQSVPGGDLQPTHCEIMLIIASQTIGLDTWKRFGKRLGRKDCIELARALIVQEIACFIRVLERADRRDLSMWFAKGIVDEAMIVQVSSACAMGELGMEDQVQQIIALHKELLSLPEISKGDMAECVRKVQALAPKAKLNVNDQAG